MFCRIRCLVILFDLLILGKRQAEGLQLRDSSGANQGSEAALLRRGRHVEHADHTMGTLEVDTRESLVIIDNRSLKKELTQHFLWRASSANLQEQMADGNSNDTRSSIECPSLPWPRFSLPHSRFHTSELSQFCEPIGQGGFGKVYRAQTVDGRSLSIKIQQHIPGDYTEVVFLSYFSKELPPFRSSVWQPSRFVTYYDSVVKNADDYIAMEYAAGRDLSYVIGNLNTMPDRWSEMQTVQRLFAEMVQGLYVMHQHGVIHRDLKPGNILLTSECFQSESSCHAKISDPGLACPLSNPASNDYGECKFARYDRESRSRVCVPACAGVAGTALYTAPELLRSWNENTHAYELDSGPEADVWTLGLILYELLFGALPWANIRPTRVKDSIMTFHIQNDANFRTLLSHPDQFSWATTSLEGMLHPHQNRWTVADVCNNVQCHLNGK